ncbi:hypothetical protein [Algibacter luteus]|uniref:hypothetical protein n=1 Tax=Algibacter luteus TaxID=1178825 RepID=UPI0025998DD1|nr:hypothetical protein [Algibacter luteus]WJJ96039.1 hypothetical protein O5O44_12485 [Algibacter luteus]
MEEKETKYLEDLLRKVIGETTIESPSLDFTNAVITRINELHKSEVTVYKPLISKMAWILIALVVVSYIIFFASKTESSNWLTSVDFKILSKINVLSDVTLSKTFTYAILFLALMFCIQIPLIKNHVNKRYEI